MRRMIAAVAAAAASLAAGVWAVVPASAAADGLSVDMTVYDSNYNELAAGDQVSAGEVLQFTLFVMNAAGAEPVSNVRAGLWLPSGVTYDPAVNDPAGIYTAADRTVRWLGGSQLGTIVGGDDPHSLVVFATVDKDIAFDELTAYAAVAADGGSLVDPTDSCTKPLCAAVNGTSSTPSATPTTSPSQTATDEPTDEPTVTDPTDDPTDEPTTDPTGEPTDEPTTDPTDEPTTDPTGEPTDEPTTDPTDEPTTDPTDEPTDEPTTDPTDEPTDEPTETATPTPTPTETATVPGDAEPDTDLSVDVTAGKTKAAPGDVLAYTVTVTNNGTDVQSDARLSVKLSAGLAFGASNPEGVKDDQTGTIDIQLGDIPAGQSTLVSVSASVNPDLKPGDTVGLTASVNDGDWWKPGTCSETATACTVDQVTIEAAPAATDDPQTGVDSGQPGTGSPTMAGAGVLVLAGAAGLFLAAAPKPRRAR